MSEYNKIINKFINEKEVASLKNIPHHNSNRLDHSLKVSYTSYKICKKLHFNYESAAKAGLLHDLYYNRIEELDRIEEKFTLFTNGHPEDAVKNAEKLFYLNALEKNIIKSHMWPLSKHMPRYKESLVVGFVDKVYSAKDFKNKFKFGLTEKLGVYFILITTFIFK